MPLCIYGSGPTPLACNRTRPSFATRLVVDSGRLATNPPRDKPIEDCSTLHRDPRQGFVTGGGRAPQQTELSGHSHVCAYVEIYTYVCMCAYMYSYAYMYAYAYMYLVNSVYADGIKCDYIE